MGLLEVGGKRRVGAWLIVGLMVVAWVRVHVAEMLPIQRGDAYRKAWFIRLATALAERTQPDDVVVGFGMDWNPEVPSTLGVALLCGLDGETGDQTAKMLRKLWIGSRVGASGRSSTVRRRHHQPRSSCSEVVWHWQASQPSRSLGAVGVAALSLRGVGRRGAKRCDLCGLKIGAQEVLETAGARRVLCRASVPSTSGERVCDAFRGFAVPECRAGQCLA
jgi:hypothetical protein